MFRKLYLIIKDFTGKMAKLNLNAFAASAAYFFFMSMVPMLILICTIIPYSPLTEENLLAVIKELISPKIVPLFEDLIHAVYIKSAGILSVAAITMIWSAGRGIMALIQGLNVVNHLQENRNYFLVRLIASLYTVGIIVCLLMCLVLMVFGDSLLGTVVLRFPKLELVFSFLLHFRLFALIVVLTFIFALIYALVPNQRQGFIMSIPGALFTSVAWCAFSYGFSLYVDFADYSIYGSLSIIILIMLWLYTCMYIIFIGAYLNTYFKQMNEFLIRKRKSRKMESEVQ